MQVSDYVAALRGDGPRLVEASAAAGLDTKVPSCPDWVVRDLVRHQGGVHRWATGIVTGPRSEPWNADLDEIVGAWPSDDDLLDWFQEGHAALVTGLCEADPDLVCWTFLAAPSPLAMWARRQAHETAMHRIDAELAAGDITPLSPDFAADGIDELLSCFITRRRSTLRADPPRTLRVRCTDIPGDWLVQISNDPVQSGPGRAGADCEVTGPASDVHLALWNRQDPSDLTVDGDSTVLDLFLDRVHVRWS
jgi:uncharacterized protein (TIGR03083 family)